MIEKLKSTAEELETRLSGARNLIAEAAMAGEWEKAQPDSKGSENTTKSQ